MSQISIPDGLGKQVITQPAGQPLGQSLVLMQYFKSQVSASRSSRLAVLLVSFPDRIAKAWSEVWVEALILAASSLAS